MDLEGENETETGTYMRGGFREVVKPRMHPKTLTDKQRADALRTKGGEGVPKYRKDWDPESEYVEIEHGGYGLTPFNADDPTLNNGRSRVTTTKVNAPSLDSMPRCSAFPSDEEIAATIDEYEDDAARVRKVEKYLNTIFRKGSRAGHSVMRSWHITRKDIDEQKDEVQLHGIVWILPDDEERGGKRKFDVDKHDILADKGEGAGKKAIPFGTCTLVPKGISTLVQLSNLSSWIAIPI